MELQFLLEFALDLAAPEECAPHGIADRSTVR